MSSRRANEPPTPAAATPVSGTCPRCAAAIPHSARYCRRCGARLPTPPPTAGALSTSDPNGVAMAADAGASSGPDTGAPDGTDIGFDMAGQRRAVRRRLTILTAAVVLLLAGYAIVSAVQRTAYGPDRPVRDLFAALAARDVATAAELAGCRREPLCQPGALSTGYQPPERVTIGAIDAGQVPPGDPTRRPNKNIAVVHVDVQLGATSYQEQVWLQRPAGGLTRRWDILTPPGGHLSIVSPHLPTARLAGADIPTVTARPVGDRADGTAFVWPGSYTLTAPDQPLLAATPTTLVVTGAPGRQYADLAVTIKPGVADEVTRQVRGRLDACATQHDLFPDVDPAIGVGCPFGYSSRYVFTKDPQWTIIDHPKVELRLGKNGVTVHTATVGHARIAFAYTLDVLEPKRWTPADGTVDITVGGQVGVDETGKIVWYG